MAIKTVKRGSSASPKGEADFAARLAQACDNHPDAPTGYGRLTWIKEQLEKKTKTEVTLETVRKWMSGLARPRPDKMTLLAIALEVDEAWLSLGISPDYTPRERKARNAMADGAVNVVAGFIQMAGGTISFPDNTGKEDADIVAIIKGGHYMLRVVLAQEVARGSYKFSLPTNAGGLFMVGVIPGAGTRIDLLELPKELVDKHGTVRGGFTEVTINRKEGAFTTGRDSWPPIKGFSERL